MEFPDDFTSLQDKRAKQLLKKKLADDDDVIINDGLDCEEKDFFEQRERSYGEASMHKRREII